MDSSFDPRDSLVSLTADIVAAHLSNNSVAVDDVAQLIQTVHGALSTLGQPEAAIEQPRAEPAVPVRSSVKPDFIVCLEDGKKLKMLKRHLMTRYRMTPDQYRAKWGLPADYPMVAPDYAEQRRSLAKKIGLGTSRNRSRGGSVPVASRSRFAPARGPTTWGRKAGTGWRARSTWKHCATRRGCGSPSSAG